jgi:RNA polymerase sigma-70 factor (ECF subfamily)
MVRNLQRFRSNFNRVPGSADTELVPEQEFADVVAGARAGDSTAFGELFTRTQPVVLRYLRVVAGGDAEDIASETWVAVIQGLHRFTGDELGFRAWVLSIARHRMIDLRRIQARHPTLELLDSHERPSGRPDETADAALAGLSTRTALELIAGLPPDQAEAVLLRVVAGLDAAAVGHLMERSPGAVRVLCHRGLKTLSGRLIGVDQR